MMIRSSHALAWLFAPILFCVFVSMTWAQCPDGQEAQRDAVIASFGSDPEPRATFQSTIAHDNLTVDIKQAYTAIWARPGDRYLSIYFDPRRCYSATADMVGVSFTWSAPTGSSMSAVVHANPNCDEAERVSSQIVELTSGSGTRNTNVFFNQLFDNTAHLETLRDFTLFGFSENAEFRLRGALYALTCKPVSGDGTVVAVPPASQASATVRATQTVRGQNPSGRNQNGDEDGFPIEGIAVGAGLVGVALVALLFTFVRRRSAKASKTALLPKSQPAGGASFSELGSYTNPAPLRSTVVNQQDTPSPVVQPYTNYTGSNDNWEAQEETSLPPLQRAPSQDSDSPVPRPRSRVRNSQLSGTFSEVSESMGSYGPTPPPPALNLRNIEAARRDSQEILSASLNPAS